MAKQVVVRYEQAGGRPHGWRILTFVLAVVAVAVLIQVVAVLITGNPDASDTERLLATNNARISLIQFLAGIGLLIGGYFTARTYLLNQHANRTDRFADAVKNMGNAASATVRIGGLHSLRLLCAENPELWSVAEQTLAEYLRECAVEGKRLSEVRAALTIFRDRPIIAGEQNPRIDLSGIDLHGLSLTGVNFERARLDDANLIECDLTDAKLMRASLIRTKLHDAKLLGADLTDADLTDAEFMRANFFRAVFTTGQLDKCDLTDAVHYNP